MTSTKWQRLFAAAVIGTGLAAVPAVAGEACCGTGDHAKTVSKDKQDIVDTAVSAGSFTTLAAALQAAGLVETLKGEGPFTVFAPTDEAFAKLPEGTVENLLKPENVEQLRAVLTYHVVAGKVKAKDVVKMNDATTVQGGKLAIVTEGDKVMINGATVTAADVWASNGVIHVIDTVLLPPAEPQAAAQ